ncbi:molybdenum cofactor guanylyltransferase [uncultured Draconibacterium sp.]|mgnify:CR=1 FL=1|uniref:molybdenum cofactor guanylyltransferase n=1 Tax=uncultured Draconibacterium sp. TaxID=1573823 RepID=UPI0025E6A69C|nr:molybdenum cofactor guanylyltransferase [uncultured Draconibacterium sp.]
MNSSAIILAGGKSKRMGTDKALLGFGGKTLLERAINLCKSFSSELLISSNHQSHSNFGYHVVADEVKNCGPMGGIYSCLKQSETDWNLVLSVDAAFVDSDFLTFLISQTGNFDAVVPTSASGAEPLIALYHKSSLPILENMLQCGDYKMHNFINKLNTNWVDATAQLKRNKKLFTNLNRPEDL